MFVAVMMKNPLDGPLEGALVEALQKALAGNRPRWLAPSEAAEFRLPVMPENFETVWKEAQAQRIDMAILPSIGRKKRLLIADMDSTMIEQECIDELADVAGVGAQVAEITARAMNGELDFEGALRERVSLLKRLESSVIETVLREKITLAPGGETLVATMKKHGAHSVLVSGGFTAFARPIAARLGFDEAQANELKEDGGRLTGAVAEPILGREAKVEALRGAVERLGISTDDVLAVGDGANDLGMLKLAGLGVALHAKPVVASQVDTRVNFADLTSLLYLQGYRRSEFA